MFRSEYSAGQRLDVSALKLTSLLMAPLILASCNATTAVDPKTPTLTSSWVRPDDPQEKLGKREHPLVLAKYGGSYSDPQAETLLAIIVGKLVAVSNDPARIYKITILDSPKVNAFALPGGYLYVTRGLLALANDSSELAAVIAHEMAHVASNHAILRQQKLTSSKTGRRVVETVLEDSQAGKLALAANQIRLAKFSQDQELQADAVGIRMIGNAGYDPFAAARFLETMKRYRDLRRRQSGQLGDGGFLSSHPTTPNRINLAKQHARFFGAPGVGKVQRDRYLKGIDGLLYGDAAKEGFVRGRSFIHGSLRIKFTAPEGFAVQNQSKAVVLTGPGQLASRFDATVMSPERNLSNYLKSGWVNGLVPESVVPFSVGELEGATGVAISDNWRFRVHVVRNGSQIYRFITAGPQFNNSIDIYANQIVQSLSLLTATQVANLKPLRVRIVTASPNDNIGKLANKMVGVRQPVSVFKTLNGLGPGSSVKQGEKYKIISE